MPQTETKRKPRKVKKNESLELLRAVTKSLAGAIPGLSDDTRNTIDDSLARVGSGMASQVMGEDPNTGEMVFPPWQNIKRSLNADERRKAGLPRQKRAMPGLVAETLALPSLIGESAPQFSLDAAEQAARLQEGANESMGLEAPEGFRQNAFNSLGTMLGQAPVPGKAKVEAVKDVGKGALGLMKHYGKKALGAPIEFFSPTVQVPSLSNYTSGALFGGTMGAIGDNPEPIGRFMQAMAEQPIPEDPRIMRPKRRLPDLDYEDLPVVTQRAEGGKVGALKQFLKAVNVNPDSTTKKKVPYQIGDPVEEVLYAVNEGTRKGVLSSQEALVIKSQLETGDEEALADSLLKLHERLFPKPEDLTLTGPGPLPLPQAPGPGELGHGKMSEEDFQAILMGKKKAKGGKVKTARKGILGILEAASKAGVPQGNELTTLPPAADLPAESIGDQLSALDLKLSKQPKKSIADTPVTRRTVLKGAAGALMPDVPISAEGLAMTAAKTVAKKAATTVDSEKLRESFRDAFDHLFNESDEPYWAGVRRAIKNIPGGETSLLPILKRMKSLHKEEVLEELGFDKYDEELAKVGKEFEDKLDELAVEHGFKKNPNQGKYGMIDPDVKMEDLDYDTYIPADYEPKSNTVETDSPRYRELIERSAAEERKQNEEFFQSLATPEEQQLYREAFDAQDHSDDERLFKTLDDGFKTVPMDSYIKLLQNLSWDRPSALTDLAGQLKVNVPDPDVFAMHGSEVDAAEMKILKKMFPDGIPESILSDDWDT